MTTGELARNFSEWFPANTQVAYQAWLPGDVVSLLKQRTGDILIKPDGLTDAEIDKLMHS